MGCHSAWGRHHGGEAGPRGAGLSLREYGGATCKEICPFTFSSFPSLKVQSPTSLSLSNIRTSLILVVIHFQAVKNPVPIYYPPAHLGICALGMCSQCLASSSLIKEMIYFLPSLTGSGNRISPSHWGPFWPSYLIPALLPTPLSYLSIFLFSTALITF